MSDKPGDKLREMAKNEATVFALSKLLDTKQAEIERLTAQLAATQDDYIALSINKATELATSRKSVLQEVIAEWDKPWGLSGGKTFIARLREMERQA